MNSQKDPLALPVIKQEFDDILITPLEGWSPLTGNITTNSCLPLSPTTTQSGENLFSPTTTTPLPNLINTYPSIASVYKRLKIVRQVKKVKRNNKRHFFANRNKFVPNDSIVQNKNTKLLFNLKLQLKQTQKQLKELTVKFVENKNANYELKLDYREFKTNANIKFDKLQMENHKLHDELNQLKNHPHTRIDQIGTNMDKVIIPENELFQVEENIDQDLNDDNSDEMSNTTNNSNDNSAVESLETSTNVRRQSNRISSKLPANSNPTKRKQSQSGRTGKRSKKTIEDNQTNQIDEKTKVNILNLNCPEPNCKIKSKTKKHLHDHLSASHGLPSYQCFAQNCNLRFDNGSHLGAHNKIRHAKPTKFVCPVCRQEVSSQHKAYVHWYRYHLSGQFQCNLNDCNLVFHTRAKVDSHQQYKHCPESKRFVCQHDDCSATFVIKKDFAQHQLVHLNRRPFHCKWLQCGHRTFGRSLLVKHIRVQHFGLPYTMKEQKERNIVEDRDPNDYVQVVDDDEDTE